MLNLSFLQKKPAAATTALAHDSYFNQLRQQEYQRLDREGQVYLDYTGGNMYAQSQLDKHFKLLSEHTFGNPHSTNPTSFLATQLVEEARAKVIDYFQAEDYYCVFTQNASMGLQIVGESYPFEENGYFLHCIDNHNSVNGLREYCIQKGGNHDTFPIHYDDLGIDEESLLSRLREVEATHKLLAFPAQSNVSGVKHNLKYIKMAQDLGWEVVLDAAAFVPTSTLSLREVQPDFVPVSFYKMFGYPTGIGCLFIKKSSFEKLHKRWFAGGTVRLASAKTPFFFLADNHERFENGTINYLGIPAITFGLAHLQQIGMQRLGERVASLMDYLLAGLSPLEHSSGVPLLNIFGPADRSQCGGTVILNFNNPDGSKIPFERMEELANARKISIRSGCFCNPGLDETNNCITTAELTDYFSNRSTGNYYDMMQSLDKMRGAIRISVGLATNQQDLDTFVAFVAALRDKTVG